MKFELLEASKVISIEAETSAEKFQITHLVKEMTEKGVAHSIWKDRASGREGISVFALAKSELG